MTITKRKMQTAAWSAACAAAAFGLSACAGLPSIQTPDTIKQMREAAGIELDNTVPPSWEALDALPAGLDQFADDYRGWVASFNDPVLNALVAEAEINNRNLRFAAQNVYRARGFLAQAEAQRKPRSSFALGGGIDDLGDGLRADDFFVDIGVPINWEIDLWGRLAAGERQAQAALASQESALRGARLSLAAQVSKAYFASIEGKALQDIQNRAVNRLERVRDELPADHSDTAYVEASIAQSRDALIRAEQQTRDSIRALNVLLGRYPSSEGSLPDFLPSAPEPAPAGLPSDLLSRRPDIVAAANDLLESYEVRVQIEKSRLPRFALTATPGISSAELSNLVDSGDTSVRLFTGIAAPLFDAGIIQSQIDVASADQEQLLARYGSVVLNAFLEVEEALDKGQIVERRQAALSRARAAGEDDFNRRMRTLVSSRGAGRQIDLIDSITRLAAIESSQLAVRRAELDQRVELHAALGGDYLASVDGPVLAKSVREDSRPDTLVEIQDQDMVNGLRSSWGRLREAVPNPFTRGGDGTGEDERSKGETNVACSAEDAKSDRC